MLEIVDLTVSYAGGGAALHGVTFRVPRGGITTVLGANGAGKTTLLRAVGGLLPFYQGAVRSGSIRLDGEETTAQAPWSLVRSGVAQVLEGRQIFTDLTVRDNLVAGGGELAGAALEAAIADAYERFPVLGQKANLGAGYLSGGEQQLLAIARATLTLPRLLLLDEPSLGLSPLMMEHVAGAVRSLADSGVTIVLVEQNARLALEMSSTAVVLVNGRVVMQRAAEDLRDDSALADAYLGGTTSR